MHNFGFWKYFI